MTKRTAWRIVQAAYVEEAFTGEGARLFGGRWNSEGVAVVYAAESISLAVLEMLVRLNRASALNEYVVLPAEFDESLVCETDRALLPDDWRDTPAPPALAEIGDEWVRSGRKPVLRVPSVLVEMESNYLLNPLHKDFGRVSTGDPQPFAFDRRLVARP